MEKLIFHTLKYFSFFNYAPTFEEIYTFLPKKTSKKKLKDELERLIKRKKLITFNFKSLTFPRYTLGEYSMKNIKYQISNIKKTYQISKRKLQNWRFRLYLRLLSFFSQIKLVGLSGSMAMMNAKEEDDIDLFIIAAKNRLFTGRFIAIVLAKLLGVHRKREGFINNICSTFHVPRYTNKVCLNLFFDEGHLEVPKFKKTEYVAHEILQMKPLIINSNIYEQFLNANSWVYKFFPNAKENSKLKTQNSKPQLKTQNFLNNFKFLTLIFNFSLLIFNLIGNEIEFLIKELQLILINRHRTNEIITNTQLWFHPEDFEKRLSQ